MKAPDHPSADPAESKPFLEHLEDLRRALIRSAVALAVGTAIALPLVPRIFTVLKKPLAEVVRDPDEFLQSIEVTGAFSVAMRIGLWSGLLISAPLLVYFIGGFIFPGLTEPERRAVLRSSGFAVALFVVGVLLGYFVTLPVALRMMFGLHDWVGIRPAPQAASYVAFSIQLLLAFGIAFQMPVVVLILGRLGILTAAQLRERRRYVLVVLLVAAMILTPPDIFTQLIMAVPLFVLYEICILVVDWSERRGGIQTG